MEPATATALLAGSQALGSVLSAGAGIFGSKKSSKSAAKIAAMQLAWEREKAQNSIQWGVQDALKAGINPAVAVGAPASAGSINPPMPDTSGYTSAGQQLSAGLRNTADVMINAKAQNTAEEVAETQGFKNIMEGLESGERTNAIPQQLQNETRNSLTAMANQKAHERNLERQNDLLEQQTVHQYFDNQIKEVEADIESGDFGRTMRKIDRILETIKNTGGAIGSFAPTVALWKGATNLKQLGGMIKEFKSSNAFKLMNKPLYRHHR